MFFRLILRFLYFILLIFLIRAAIRALFPGTSKKKSAPASPGDSPHRSSPIISGHMEKDPVCGVYIDKQTAFHMERQGQVFYFCSRECQSKFQNMGK